MIKIAICDDDISFVDRIEKMLIEYEKNMNQSFLIKKYTKPLYLMDSLKEDFQIFFLDIEMPCLNGVELTEIIRKYDERSIIIFVTSHGEYIAKGYDYDVQNYITKPITQIQINCEMNRAFRKLGTYNQKYIAVKNSKGFMKLFLSDIEYIETKDRNVLFHCVNGRQEIGHFKMQVLEEKLRDCPFIRCHNGIIVNVDYIDSIHDFTVTLLSGKKIFTTKSRKKALIQKVAERKGCV